MNRLLTLAFLASFFAATVVADEDSLVSGELVWKGEMWHVADGGLESGSRSLHNVDLGINFDLSKAGMEGATFYVQGLFNNKSELSGDLVGDMQVVSNIDNGEIGEL